jgi:hypothetical protein
MVAAGKVPGAVNLAAQIQRKGPEVAPTWKIRSGIEKSWGHVVAADVGLVEDKLAAYRLAQVASGRIPAAQTRLALESPWLGAP